ncbi:nucleotide-binding protein [Actinobacillus equuli subsp. haemolyticus]|uniref:nucleotide-binding protein n=1 Tax=Actinobacillus equuli TaxID=718 RepID=UPI0024467D6C|nr:nucleotide-binding protein [Actinobacillus equuli]WGE50793.1 nucleotide-binding protein [Actinobacillus equuli subsp. haemolyticus]
MDSKIKIVENLITQGEQFNFRNFCIPRDDHYAGRYGGSDKSEWLTFKTRVRNIVNESFAVDSAAVKLVNRALLNKTKGNGPETFELVKNSLITALKQLLEALKDDVYGELKKDKSIASSPALSNKVFIVHGHDETLKLDVENFVHEIGLEPVVLHRQTNEGQTIIEKFEKNSDVGFAFILLTPDEISYTIDQKDKVDNDRKTEFRARPNVIFEFGYFVGKLGRGRVCCLLKGNTQIPSDVSGVVYHKIENNIEEKAYAIIKELKAVGYQIKV